jgi:hypothetical protein
MALAARTISAFSLAALLLCSSRSAQAEATTEDKFSLDEEESAAAKPEPEPQSAILGDEQAIAEEQAPEEKFRSGLDPWEDPKKNYFFAGAAWRFVRMPAWILSAALDEAPAFSVPGSLFGEFGYRHDGFQITGQVGWINYAFNGPFQLAGDPITDIEWLDAKFNILMGTATFTWSTAFADWFSLEYGVEAGIAALVGKMTRTEARPAAGGGYSACPTWASQGTQINPQWTSGASPTDLVYCDPPLPLEGSNVIPTTNQADEIGAHYGIAASRGIANKGVPYALPVVGPRLSLRFKPIHQLVLRVDVPLPVFPLGFVGGLAAQYGF